MENRKLVLKSWEEVLEIISKFLEDDEQKMFNFYLPESCMEFLGKEVVVKECIKDHYLINEDSSGFYWHKDLFK